MMKLPIVRHVRYFWRSFGYLPVHAEHDFAVLNDIWDGKR